MRKHLLLVFLLTFASLAFINIGSDKAYAATGTWLNRANIQVGSDIYLDSNPNDSNLSFRLDGATGSCVPRIENFSTSDIDDVSRLGSATLKLFPQDASGACPEQTDPITLSNTPDSAALFSWVDAGNIEYVVDGLNFTLFSGTTFSADTAGSCKSTLDVTSDTTANYTPRLDIGVDGCRAVGTSQVQIANPVARGTAAGTGTSQVGLNQAGVAANTESCEEVGGAFGPIMCPFLNMLDDTFGWIDEKISDALTVKEAYYKGQCTNGGTTCTADQRFNPVKGAWSNVRNVAYILLIPMMLIMVIGTALGFGFVDAYTVKRAMPRLLIAIVFITLSYNICVIMIDVFNAVGKGVGGLVAQPFGGSENLTISRIFPGAGSGEAVAGTAILAGLTWAAVGSAAIVGLLATFIAPVVLILVIIYALLLIRELLLIFALIFAPLAILSWIFPGNDKLWKLWWGTFSKMLYIFPIIMGFIMVGRGFASMVNAVDDGGVTITILKGIAFVGPYFFIPKAFQMAGGAFASIAGMANDRGRGVFDRAKKKRGAITAQRGHDLKTGNANNFLARKTGMTAAGRRIGVGAKGRYGFGQRGSSALDLMDNTSSEEYEKSPEFNGTKENDGLQRAAASGRTFDESVKNQMKNFNITEQEARTNARQVQATIGFGRKQQLSAAKQLVKTGTGYDDLHQMEKTLAVAANGNSGTASGLAGFANSITKQVGRHDLAPSYSTLNSLLQARVNPQAGHTEAAQKTATDDAIVKSVESSSVYELVNAKPKAIENVAKVMKEHLLTGTDEQKTKALTFFSELDQGKSNAKGGSRDAIERVLSDNPTDPKSAGILIRSAGSDVVGTTTEKRRVAYDSTDASHAAWSTEDKTRGWITRDVTRSVTRQEVAAASARKYEPPDPNKIT